MAWYTLLGALVISFIIVLCSFSIMVLGFPELTFYMIHGNKGWNSYVLGVILIILYVVSVIHWYSIL